MAFATIYFAKDLLLPIVIGLLLSATLSPVVRVAERRGVAPPITAIAMILSICLAFGAAALFLGGSITAWLDQAPQMGAELREKLSGIAKSVEAMQSATEQVEEITEGEDNEVQRVVIDQPGFLNIAVSNLMAFATSLVVGVILALFFLASGDLFIVKLVQYFSSMQDKKRAVRIVSDIQRRISNYLLSITLINAGLGVAIGAALYAVGLPYWWLWGFAAFCLNFLPFLGAIFGVMMVAAYSVVTFDSIYYAAVPPLVYLALTSLEGQFLTPCLLGRRLDLNTVSVFLTVMFWGWLWGVPGALMAVPFLVCFKVICDHVDGLGRIGNFLGGREEIRAQKAEPVPAE